MTNPVMQYAADALLEGWLAVMLFVCGRTPRGVAERWSMLLADGQTGFNF